LSSHCVLHSSQVTFDNILNFYPSLELRERTLEQQWLRCKTIWTFLWLTHTQVYTCRRVNEVYTTCKTKGKEIPL
jgi:hypothetical protein